MDSGPGHIASKTRVNALMARRPGMTATPRMAAAAGLRGGDVDTRARRPTLDSFRGELLDGAERPQEAVTL